MSDRWKYFIPGYLWALPMSLVGLLLGLTLYFPKRIRWRDGCLEIVPRRENLIGGPWVGGQTYGWVIFLRDERMLEHAELAVHERGHVVQALLLGPLFPVAYGILFAINYAHFRSDWRKAYRYIWFEVYCYDLGERYAAGDLPDAWGNR